MEPIQKNFAIDIKHKLYEKETATGHLIVYETVPHGMMLTLDGQVLISEHDGFFYHEMMAHPVLFTHQHPKKIAILGHGYGILQEVLKHSHIKHVFSITENAQLDAAVAEYFVSLYQAKTDPRVSYEIADPFTWLSHYQDTFDIIIQSQHSQDCSQEQYQVYLQALRPDGIFVQPCQASVFDLRAFKSIFKHVAQAGFSDWQLLNFPQPSYPTGWRMLMMATKNATFKSVREKDVFNRPFSTRYYNFDTHKAALALPEFMRLEFGFDE